MKNGEIMTRKKKPLSCFFGKMSKEDADAMLKDIEEMRKNVTIRDIDFDKIRSERKRKGLE